MTKENQKKSNNPFKTLKILVCDDENQIQEFLWNLLSEEGHDIDFAKDGEEVFKILGKTKYDLLILDVNIPKMNGYKVSEKICKIIKNRPRILIFTARDIESEKLQFACSDADAILQKGTASIDSILKTISELFPKQQDNSIKEPAHTSPPSASLSNRIIDQNRALNLNSNANLKYCFDKISRIETLTANKMNTYEEFIRYMLTEKQNAAKNLSELKNLKIRLKALQIWLYILFAMALIAIAKSFL